MLEEGSYTFRTSRNIGVLTQGFLGLNPCFDDTNKCWSANILFISKVPQ